MSDTTATPAQAQAQTTAQAPLLAVEGLTVRFAGVTALSDVSFAVRPGQLFAVIGPNGAGKTSLFNVISRVYQPAAGRVIFDGQDMAQLRTHQTARAGIARTFQNLGQFPFTTVLDYLPLGVLPYGLQKRADLARALAMRPKLLLLDEPVAGMSLEESRDMAAVILDIKEQLGVTQILVEHDMAMVMGIADRVLVLDFGRVIAEGDPAAVQANPDVIRAYLGEELGGPARANGAHPGAGPAETAP